MVDRPQREQCIGPCRLGCGGGEDSIEHLARCPRVHALMQRHLGLPPPTRRWALDAFLGFRWSTETSVVALLSERGLRALGNYAIYRCHSALRHHRLSPPLLDGAFHEFIREGRRGCALTDGN